MVYTFLMPLWMNGPTLSSKKEYNFPSSVCHTWMKGTFTIACQSAILPYTLGNFTQSFCAGYSVTRSSASEIFICKGQKIWKGFNYWAFIKRKYLKKVSPLCLLMGDSDLLIKTILIIGTANLNLSRIKNVPNESPLNSVIREQRK